MAISVRGRAGLNRLQVCGDVDDSGTSDDSSTEDPRDFTIVIQGFAPTVCAVQRGRRDRKDRDMPEPRSRRRSGTPRFDGTCDACGKFGHTATRCNMLVMFIFLQRYFKKASEETLKKAEHEWMERNKPWLEKDKGRPLTEGPRKIGRRYQKAMRLSTDELAAQLDPIFWMRTEEEEEDDEDQPKDE